MHTERHASKYCKHKRNTSFSLSTSLENNIVKGHGYFLWDIMQCYWCESNTKRFWNCKYRNSIATYLLNTCFPSVLLFKISQTFLAGIWAFPHIFSTKWPLTINSWTYKNKKTLFWNCFQHLQQYPQNDTNSHAIWLQQVQSWNYKLKLCILTYLRKKSLRLVIGWVNTHVSTHKTWLRRESNMFI